MINQFPKELHINVPSSLSHSLFTFMSVHSGTRRNFTDIKTGEENISKSVNGIEMSQNY
jgi:hypothetical protein